LSLSAYADMSGRNGGQFRDHSFAQDLNASTDAATSSLGQLLIIVVAPTMFIFWQGLDLFQWTMAVGMTLVVLAGQYLIIKAYDYCEASMVAPFAYIEIIIDG